MTVEAMHKAIIQQLNDMKEKRIPSEDIDLYINKSIDQFIKDRFEPRSNELQLGFEQSQKRIDDLRELIKESGELDTEEVTIPFEDNIFIDKTNLPSDYMFLINVSASIQYNDSGVTYTVVSSKRTVVGSLNTEYAVKSVRCKFIQLDDLYQSMTDFFNKTKIKTPKYTINTNSVYVYTDEKFIVDKIYITYIRQPALVSLESSTDCDLADSTHEEIVDIAVQLIQEDLLSNSVSRPINNPE